MNLSDDLKAALNTASAIDRAVVDNLGRFTEIFLRHIRDISPYWLKKLKAVLVDFDSRDGTWK